MECLNIIIIDAVDKKTPWNIELTIYLLSQFRKLVKIIFSTEYVSINLKASQRDVKNIDKLASNPVINWHAFILN